MQQVIRQLVTDSFADNSYDKVYKALEGYRAEAIEVVSPGDDTQCSLMNHEISTSLLNPLRKIFWRNIGLITFAESEVDQVENIGEEEAKSVMPDCYEGTKS